MIHRALLATLILSLSPMVSARVPAGESGASGECTLLVVRASFDDPRMLQELASWIEPWEIDRRAGSVVVGTDEAGVTRLRRAGFRVVIDHERTRELCAPRRALKDQASGIPGYPCYRTVEETFLSAADLAAAWPDLVEIVDIGDSWEKTVAPDSGADLLVLRLTNRSIPGTGTPADPDGKPVLFIMASMHAREYAPAELVTRFAERLVSAYGDDPEVTWILDEHEIHILLQANPDGRRKAEQGQLWRKNTDNEFCSDTSNRGVDLNRNYEYEWGCCGGSSGSECSEIYRGPSPASEPETQAVQDYVRQIFPEQWNPVPPDDATGIFLDVHSYGRLVLWAWGYTPDPAPNWRGTEALGRRMAFLNGHQAFQAFFFYPTDGTTDDFVYGELGVAAFTFEVGYRFFEPCLVFELAILEENIAAMMYAAKAARAPYRDSRGPEVIEVAFETTPVVRAGELVEVRAVADDGRMRGGGQGQAIATVEAFVGRPPWSAEAPAPIGLLPADGAFDSPVEEAHGFIDTAGLAPGRYLVFLRGTDAEGFPGVVTARYLWVDQEPGPRRLDGGRR